MGWKTSAAVAAAILCVFGISAPDAEAAGIGFYVGGGTGSGDQTSGSGFFETTDDSSNSFLGIGFALDTNVLNRKSVFNYRLNAGYESMNTEEDFTNTQIDWNGFVIEQDFGFGGKPGGKVRLWGGPCLRLSYHVGTDQIDNDYSVYGIGIGPVVGANIGVAKSVAITVRTGFLFNGYAGDSDRVSGSIVDFSMAESRWFLTVGMLFGGSR